MEAGKELDTKLAEVMGFPTAKDWFKEIPHKVAEQRGDDYLRLVDFLPNFSTDSSWIVQILEKIREITGKCALLEASVNPKEYLCTVGWHHRGQWFKDFQFSSETASHVVCLAFVESLNYRIK